jgi:diaminopimelate epimerase
MNAEKKNHFYKMHGAGNDFILIDNRADAFDATDHRKIKKMCAHHIGIGADGLMLISESVKNDFKLEYFNANGLPAEMCGNGARCAVSLAHRLKLAPHQCSFEIDDKNYQAEVLKNGFVRLSMGSSTLLMDDVQMRFLRKPEFKSMYWMEAGVPHLVIIVKDLPDKLDDIVEWGKHLRYHWMFRPRGTNVNFIYPFDKNHLQGRVYERGVENETLACGTGAVACAFVAMKEYGWNSPISVHYPGGQLQVEFDGDFQDVFLNGRVFLTFEGEFNSDYFECI